MPRRRRRGARRRTSGSVILHDFFGWKATDNGNEIRVTASMLSIPSDRPMRPVSVRLEVDSVATTSTYMIPSNSPVLSASLVSATGNVLCFTKPTLIPHGTKTRIFLRAPRTTDFSQYGVNSTVLFLHFSQPAAGTTVSYSGSIGMSYSRHQLARGVKLEQHIEELDRQFAACVVHDV